MSKRETGRKFHFSKLNCPACGYETRAVLRVGTVRVRCERCGALLEMTIRVIETRRSRFIGTGAAPACPTGRLPPHAARSPQPTFRGYTELMCPACGRRTGASVRTGTAIVYCRRCRGLIEMTVEVVRGEWEHPSPSERTLTLSAASSARKDECPRFPPDQS